MQDWFIHGRLGIKTWFYANLSFNVAVLQWIKSRKKCYNHTCINTNGNM